MGLFSNLLKKEECAFCYKEVGMLSRTKLKDDTFICSDCVKDCSPYISAVRYTKEEIDKHIRYMQKQDEFYRTVFLEDPNLETISKFINESIIFSDKYAMFAIVNGKTKLRHYQNVFRYDQIRDFKMYKENNPEDAKTKYSEIGVVIKLLSDSKSDTELENFFTSEDLKEYTCPYLDSDEFKLLTDRNVNEVTGGLLSRKLERILGLANEGNLSIHYKDSDRESYRNISEVGRFFERKAYKDIADNAEKEFMGETFKEFLNK